MNSLYEKILNSKKIKYEILNKFIPNIMPPQIEMEGKYNSNINIFINIQSLYNSLYNPDLMELFKTLNRRESYLLAADIANMCGHYRHYFATFQKCYTTFYLYYSDQPSNVIHTVFPDYKKKFYYKRYEDPNFQKLNRIFQVNMKILEEFIPYLPHIYIINTKEYDPVLFPGCFLNKITARKCFNVFITYEEVELQYYAKNNFILYPKGNKSYILDGINYYLVNELSNAKILNKDVGSYDLIAKEFLPVILTLSGNPKYEIPAVNGLTKLKMLRFLYDHIHTKKRVDLVISLAEENKFERVLEVLLKTGRISEKDANLAYDLRELVDINHIVEHKAPNSFIRHCKNSLRDTVDLVALKKLNKEYYSETPLYLDFLLEAENY